MGFNLAKFFKGKGNVKPASNNKPIDIATNNGILKGVQSSVNSTPPPPIERSPTIPLENSPLEDISNLDIYHRMMDESIALKNMSNKFNPNE